jgi:hypothetical protein
MSGCAECGCQLGRGNTSGYCIRHVSAANARNPEWREKQRAGLRKKLQADPIYLERKRDDMRKANRARDIEKLRQRMVTNRYWEMSNSGRPPGHPSRVQAGRSNTETKLADIPPHLRDEYRRLNCIKHIPAAEAKAIILAQHDAEMARFRRKVSS